MITTVLITVNEAFTEKNQPSNQPNKQNNRKADCRLLHLRHKIQTSELCQSFARQNVVERELDVYFKICLPPCYVIAVFVRGQGRSKFKNFPLYYSHGNKIGKGLTPRVRMGDVESGSWDPACKQLLD